MHLLPPEGRRLHTPENLAACASETALQQAMEQQQVLDGIVRFCDAEHNLIVSLGNYTGLIPRAETALGIDDGSTREIAILTLVGKPISFIIERLEEKDGQVCPILSRCRAQRMALEQLMDTLTPGMVIPATVTHLEPFGAFVDVGCGIPSMIGIETISVSRIPHPLCRFTPGQEIYAAVASVDKARSRVVLTHKELLGTWEENAAQFSPGMTVSGYVRGIKEYGAFIELTPNLSGLAEPREGLREGDRVSVYIKAIFPSRMKIKLLVIDTLPPLSTPEPLHYFISSGTLNHWQYALENCTRQTQQTIF